MSTPHIEYAPANREWVVWPEGRPFDSRREAEQFAAKAEAEEAEAMDREWAE